MINAPPLKVFDLARDVSLHEVGAKGTQERAVAGVNSGLLALGDTVTWRAKHFGLWQNLTVRITTMEPPALFVDEMTQGAFRSMRHVHKFEEVASGTRMIDEFEFEAPFGILGRIAERAVLERYMRRFLISRNAFLKQCAENPPPPESIRHR